MAHHTDKVKAGPHKTREEHRIVPCLFRGEGAVTLENTKGENLNYDCDTSEWDRGCNAGRLQPDGKNNGFPAIG